MQTHDPRLKEKFNRQRGTKPGTVLHFPIMINDIIIADVAARNVTLKSGQDDVNTYKVSVSIYSAFNGQGELHSRPNRHLDFELEHRYGDGAIVLVQKIFTDERVQTFVNEDPAV